jgi:GT2 family glycosyltransferase
MAVDVSFIIPAYKAKDYLKIALDSIRAQMPDVNYEVIVIEDFGEDGSLEMLRQDFDWIKLISNEKNLGLIQSRRNGIEVAAGEFIFLFDSDVEMLAGAYETLLQAMREDERLGFVTCNKKSHDDSHQRSVFAMPTLWNSFVSMIPFMRQRQIANSRSEHENVCDPGWMSPGHSLIRREAWDDVGGQSPQFFFFGEEIDFCHKLRAKNWNIRFFPHMGFIHYGSVSQKGDRLRFRKMSWLGSILLADLYWPRWQALILRLLYFVRGIAVCFKDLFAGRSPMTMLLFSFKLLSPKALKNNHLT